MISTNLKNALLEAARLVVFAVPGILIQVVSNDPTLASVYGGLILVVLKAIDRAVHQNSNTSLTGILPF